MFDYLFGFFLVLFLVFIITTCSIETSKPPEPKPIKTFICPEGRYETNNYISIVNIPGGMSYEIREGDYVIEVFATRCTIKTKVD